MSNKILTFSGWGQKTSSLSTIAPDAEHIGYCNYRSIGELFDSLKGKDCDVAIGWSLGGQLVLRAIDEGVIAPRKLFLISTPFQFLESDNVPSGMHKHNFHSFKSEFIEDPYRILKRFAIMVCRNDKNSGAVLKQLDRSEALQQNWLYWLEQLENFSCYDLSFNNMPETLLIHGQDDTIVDLAQTALFLPFIRNCALEVIPKCGHAPHLHDPVGVKNLIEEYI